MKLDYGKEFMILRVVGVFISSMIVAKGYGLYSDYQPGSMFTFSAGAVFGLFMGILIVLFCFTMYWRIELNARQVISNYGFLLLHKRRVFEGIESIEFKVAFIEVKNGPDKAYINVLVKVVGRDRSYPVCALYQLRESILMPDYYKKKHQKEIDQFDSEVQQLLGLYPNIGRSVDDKVPAFYEDVTGQKFVWGENH